MGPGPHRPSQRNHHAQRHAFRFPQPKQLRRRLSGLHRGTNYTQRVYDLLMKSGSTAIASGKKIAATYFPDEQKFYVTEAECA